MEYLLNKGFLKYWLQILTWPKWWNLLSEMDTTDVSHKLTDGHNPHSIWCILSKGKGQCKISCGVVWAGRRSGQDAQHIQRK